MNLNNLERQAILAAYPFGGSALEFQLPVLEGLESKGLVEILCTSLDGYGYGLTCEGKKVYKELKENY